MIFEKFRLSILVLGITVFVLSVKAQKSSERDSIEKELLISKEDTNKVNSFNDLSKDYTYNGDYTHGFQCAEKGLKLAEKLGYKKGIANSINNIGLTHDMQGNYANALLFYNRALKIREEIKDKKGIAFSYNNIGIVYDFQGNYNKALEYQLKALSIREEIKDQKGIGASLNNIGILYKKQGNFTQALNYYFKALKIHEELGNKKLIGVGLNNIGSVYGFQKQYEKEREYYSRSLKIKEELGDKAGIATILNNLGTDYVAQKKYSEALIYFAKSMKIEEELGNKMEICSSNNEMGNAYNGLGDYQKALTYLNSAVKLSREIGNKETEASACEHMAEAYEKSGNHALSLKNYKLFMSLKDSILNEKKFEEMANMRAQYEFDQKEKESKLITQQKETEQKAALDKQKMISYSAGGGGLLVLMLTLVLVKSNRHKKKANLVLESQKSEITSQKEIIEVKNRDILDSIKYAKRIQQTILPSDELIKSKIDNSFVLYKPKDIVSGDFYFIQEKNESVFFAVADCTGHGVPGALVSIVGHNALTRAMREYALERPSEILDKVNQLIEDSFGNQKDEEINDGMDIALCNLSLANRKLEYSGANNPLFIIRNSELIEIKPDKQPIGKFDKKKNFTNHSIDIFSGDSIYIFSDGYADQFGGTEGKKFKTSRFKELLISLQTLPFSQQKDVLNETIEQWRGELDQVDDICLIGVKI